MGKRKERVKELLRDKEQEDRVLEQIVIYYEAGLL